MSAQEQRPRSDQLKQELHRETERKRYSSTLRNTIYILIVVAAVSVLLSAYLVSVLRVEGISMAPNLEDRDLVLAVHTKRFEPGDVVGFYYNNRILLKRVVGSPGDLVDMDEDGTLYVNGIVLEERYLSEKDYGDYTDIGFPYQVPEKRFFVIGDNRKESIDSRSSAVGTVTSEQVVGKVIMRIWPLSSFGGVR